MNDENKKELTEGYISLRHHFETLFNEREKQVNIIFSEREKQLNLLFRAAEETLKVNKVDLQHRIDKVNGLQTRMDNERAEMDKQHVLYTPKIVYDAQIKDYGTWITGVNDKLTILMTTYSGKVTLSTWVSIFSLLLSLAAFILMLYKIVK
jgi:hypothetical protein